MVRKPCRVRQVNGQATGNDFVNVNDQSNAIAPTYTITSTTVSRFPGFFGGLTYSGIKGLRLNGSSGADTYNVVSTAAGTPVTLNGGNGNDTFNVSPTAQNLDSIQGALSLFGGGGTDSVILNDQAKAGNTTYSLTSTTVNRTGAAQISYTNDEGLTLNGGSGADTYNVVSTAAGTPVTLNGGNGNDTFNVSPTAQNLDSIQGALSLFGGGGTDSVILNDQAKVGNTTYSLTSTTVNRTGAAQISYTDDEGLTLNGGSGADTYNVVSTAAGTPVTLNGGNGNDTFNVSPTAQNLDSIQGALSLFGGGGTDSVILNDQAKAGNTTYSLTSTTVNRTGAAQISYTDDEGLTLNGGSGADTYNVVSTAAGTPVTLNGGNGNDTFNVSPTAQNLDSIQGALSLFGGGGTDSVILNDQAKAGDTTYSLTSTTVNRTGAAQISYTDDEGLTLNGGSGADTYNVVSTAAGTPVTLNGGNGNDTFNVSPTAQNLDSIQGALSLFGGGGTDSVILNDQAKAGDTTYSLTSTTVNRTGAAQISYTDDEGLTLNGGSGADTYNVVSTAAGTPVTLNGGNGNDTFNVSPTAQNLDSIQGALSLFGGGGTDSVILNDQAKAGDTTYSLTSTTVNRTGAAQISHAGDEGLTLNGGSGVNTYNVQQAGILARINAGTGDDTIKFSNGAGVTGLVDGQAGIDTLDYSLYTTPISIDLVGRTATGIGGFANIERIIA